jgi:hypothetical protein
MSQITLNPPLYHSQELNTGDAPERGDSPKRIVDDINTMMAEIYAAETARAALEAVESAIKFVDVTVSSAELLALFATPKTLVAAPAAGFMNVFEGIVISKPAGTAYAGIAGGEDLLVSYTDASGTALATLETTGFLDQATVQTRYAPAYKAASGVNSLTPTNTSIVMSLLVGEIITGTSALNCRVYYRVIPSVLA